MLKLKLGNHAGRSKTFNNFDDIYNYFGTQAQKWLDFGGYSKQKIFFGESKKKYLQIRLVSIRQRWLDLQAMSRRPVGELEPSDKDIIDRLDNSIVNDPPISVDSSLGQFIAALILDADPSIAASAIDFHNASPDVVPFQNLTKAALSGAIAYELEVLGLEPEAARKAKARIAQVRAELQADASTKIAEMSELLDEYRSHMSTIRDDAIKNDADFKAICETFINTIEKERQLAEDSCNTQREEFQESWQGISSSYAEHLKIESSVRLWNERAIYYSKSAKSRQSFVLLIGIVGLILSVAIAWATLDLARWLFNDAIINADNSAKVTHNGLRPTFHFELIFVASTILLYLTMYLWCMRVLVRMYMTEFHLGIDALARASMAETYLALIKENAASDADRAIVLSALFRPVVDGIVKDDGLPLFTPAGMLSGALASKSGS